MSQNPFSPNYAPRLNLSRESRAKAQGAKVTSSRDRRISDGDPAVRRVAADAYPKKRG